MAVEVFDGRASRPQQIEEGLRPIYVPDNEFINDFSTAAFSTTQQRKIVRYVLANLEGSRSKTSVDFETVDATIEHVLPENPGEGWEWSDEDRERFTSRLGNLTLLEFGPNRDAAFRPFEQKLPIYRKSRFVLTNSIRGAAWTPLAIEERQLALAREAAAIWRL